MALSDRWQDHPPITWLEGRQDVAATGEAIERASAVIARLRPADDSLFPAAILAGHRLLGRETDPEAVIESWRPGGTRETGSIRYRWAIDPRLADALPACAGPEASWQPWRDRDRAASATEPSDRVGRLRERLLTPLAIADGLDFLTTVAERPDEVGMVAQEFIAEAMPKVRRDAAGWVQELHAWSDTWALWALARRPGALTLLHPFALAIADAYAAAARRSDNIVLGTRFPYHRFPLVSGSAQLATGLVALGYHPKLVANLATWIIGQRHRCGGWGDADDDPDPLTTLVAADLLGSLDPDFDPSPTAAWLGARQRSDGWWRAMGPEATWLTVEILGWMLSADRPFADRFRWPHLALANRDRRTDLPHYGYYSDLARLCTEVAGLAASRVEVAFIDLAGFGEFNNAFGMEVGDRAIRALAGALARIPGAMAIRDGGDEFIVLGTPTATGLAGRLASFRETWPAEFAATFGDSGIVPARILTATTTGDRLVEARNRLGLEVGAVKRRWPSVGRDGLQVDLGWLA